MTGTRFIVCLSAWPSGRHGAGVGDAADIAHSQQRRSDARVPPSTWRQGCQQSSHSLSPERSRWRRPLLLGLQPLRADPAGFGNNVDVIASPTGSTEVNEEGRS